MSKKKILYIGLLVAVLVIIGIFVVIVANRTERLEVSASNNTNLGNKSSETPQVTKPVKTATVTNLDDGVLYSVSDEEFTPDIVIGNEYFDTQMADINLNFSNYEGKTVEIEGMSLTNTNYTFVGRFTTANICPSCPTGYSYMEYEWYGDQTPELVEEQSWLKVKGTFKRGKDDSGDYYYIDVASLEVMNEQGQTTVTN